MAFAALRITSSSWILRGTTSNSRYTNREELKALSVKQEMLLRPQATRAALIGPTFLPFLMLQKKKPGAEAELLNLLPRGALGGRGLTRRAAT